MRSANLWGAVLVSVMLLSVPVGAQKKGPADVSGIAFVTGVKGDHPHLYGLNAVLMLTDEQKQLLVAARQETVASDTVVAAGRKVKGDPNATEADRQAARRLAEEAQGSFERRVATILTPAQKEMVLRLQVLYRQAQETTSSEYAPKLVQAKGNEAETLRLRQEARAALDADFARRVNEIVTVEQRSALEAAAAQERQRDAAAKLKGK